MQFYMRNNVFQNNIIYIGKHGRRHDQQSGRTDPNTPTVVMDHNLYYFPGGPKEAKWRFDNQDYAELGRVCPGDRHGPELAFCGPAVRQSRGRDFRLRKDSPARGAGRNLGVAVTGNEDLAGAPRVKAPQGQHRLLRGEVTCRHVS